MSEQQQDSKAGSQAPQGQLPLDPEILEHWANVRLGQEGMMLEKIQRQNRVVEDSVRGLQKEAGYESTVDDEDMGVSIGNKTYNITPQPPALAPAPAPEKKNNVLLPAALALGGLATGGGLGAAGLLIGNAISNRPAAVEQILPDIPAADPGFGVPTYKDGYEYLDSGRDSSSPADFVPK